MAGDPASSFQTALDRGALLRGFRIGKVYRGKMLVDYIGVTGEAAAGPDSAPVVFAEGGSYLLLLRPSQRLLDVLGKRRAGRNRDDALQPDEVVAVVEPSSTGDRSSPGQGGR